MTCKGRRLLFTWPLANDCVSVSGSVSVSLLLPPQLLPLLQMHVLLNVSGVATQLADKICMYTSQRVPLEYNVQYTR